MTDQEGGVALDPEIEDVPLTLRQLRRDALAHDALLFCWAFSVGALVYALTRAGSGETDTVWSISLSSELILSGLLAGEAFLLWNNGWRQGVRGHSVGKHRKGLRVVDAATGRPTGPVRGLARGAVMVVLLDLSLAAIPFGLPTALRSLTPDDWHIGAAAYVALVLLVVPLLLPTDRGLADRVLSTRVEEADGDDATTSVPHRRALVALDLLGVVGVVVVGALYLHFYGPLLWRFPSLW